MNIAEIKGLLGISTLNLNTAKDKDGQPTEWMRHWDNDKRVAVSIHKETVAKIEAGSVTTLGIQSKTRIGAKGEYKAIRIVQYTPAEKTM